jgi:tetratricopeptide (TPR) repeat protein
MLLRLAEATGDLYPDESAPLLDAAFGASDSASRTETMVAVHCLRVKRVWLLERSTRAELARVELARAKCWSRPDDTAKTHAALALGEAEVALAAGSTSEGEVAAPLARACELFRPTAPRQAAVTGMLLGDFWRSQGRFERAVTTFQIAAEDARTAGDHALAAQSELGELGAAVDGEIDPEDAPDRLRALADRFRGADHAQREGVARANLGRCLLRRGLRDLAIVELEHARGCFAATTDMASELAVARLRDATA